MRATCAPPCGRLGVTPLTMAAPAPVFGARRVPGRTVPVVARDGAPGGVAAGVGSAAGASTSTAAPFGFAAPVVLDATLAPGFGASPASCGFASTESSPCEPG